LRISSVHHENKDASYINKVEKCEKPLRTEISPELQNLKYSSNKIK